MILSLCTLDVPRHSNQIPDPDMVFGIDTDRVGFGDLC